MRPQRLRGPLACCLARQGVFVLAVCRLVHLLLSVAAFQGVLEALTYPVHVAKDCVCVAAGRCCMAAWP